MGSTEKIALSHHNGLESSVVTRATYFSKAIARWYFNMVVMRITSLICAVKTKEKSQIEKNKLKMSISHQNG